MKMAFYRKASAIGVRFIFIIFNIFYPQKRRRGSGARLNRKPSRPHGITKLFSLAGEVTNKEFAFKWNISICDDDEDMAEERSQGGRENRAGWIHQTSERVNNEARVFRTRFSRFFVRCGKSYAAFMMGSFFDRNYDSRSLNGKCIRWFVNAKVEKVVEDAWGEFKSIVGMVEVVSFSVESVLGNGLVSIKVVQGSQRRRHNKNNKALSLSFICVKTFCVIKWGWFQRFKRIFIFIFKIQIVLEKISQ